MVFGRKPEAVEGGAPPPPGVTPPPPAAAFATFAHWLFNRPTDVAWDPAGNSFIADGYGNSRVMKFDRDGNWVQRVGQARNSAWRISHTA